MANPIEIQSYLKGVAYPATKQELLDKAEENGASGEVTEALNALPDTTYNTPAEVQSAWAEGGDDSE
ncbi:MAG: hypothetical protein JWM92_529 [Candidatus Nomurabacteria bacterium]|jgi:hypothetical protein|nr:hypothetical protein [Candidatus Nomurabacteria bacterium]